MVLHCLKHVGGGSAKRQLGLRTAGNTFVFDKLRSTITLAAAGRARTVASFVGTPRDYHQPSHIIMSLERVIIYLEAYDYDVCAWYRQVIALWVANEAISAGDENSSAWWIPRALKKLNNVHNVHN